MKPFRIERVLFALAFLSQPFLLLAELAAERSAAEIDLSRDYEILRESAIAFTNLARNRPATQSSTYSQACNPVATKATDGNNEGVFYPWCSVTHTNADPQAWWEVDLGYKSLVSSVIVFNRVDCCMDRLSNFDVILKNPSHAQIRSIHEVQGGREIMAFSMHPTVTNVQYVRVQLRGTNCLSLAEVEVYGTNDANEERDLARFKKATQSSTYSHVCSPTASVAVDGNTEGVFYPWCSVTHTNNDQQAWWQVDLGRGRSVNSVYVFNRVDCCMERLANFNVTLKSDKGSVLATQHFAGGTSTEIYKYMQNVEGVRYVRIHLLGQNYLSLAEVQVWGSG